MNLNRLKLSALTLAGAVFIFSCGGGNQENSSDASAEFESAKEQVAIDVAKVLEDLPPPAEVPLMLMQTGADFNPEAVNSITTEQINAYQQSESKAALNLGIYATDIGYLTSYDKSELALEYMGQCQKLAAPVGVGDAIDYGMVARFEANMENKDSLAVVVNEVMRKSGERLAELDELNSAALLLAGSWIEGIHISTFIVDTYPDDLPDEARTLILEPLVKVVMDQKTSLNDLLKVLNDVPESDDVNAIIGELQKVKAIYDGELAEVEKQIAENTGDYVLLPSALNNLAKEVNRIRTSIVQ